MAETQIRYARTTDGVNIAYFTMGSGVPLVFVQIPMSNLQHELSDPRIRSDQEVFARNALLVRYDHRGLGVSDRWDAPFTTEGFVRDLEAVVDKLELRRFLLVAIHHNAYPIALAYAALHPDRVISMAVMIGGTSSEFASSVLDMPDADWRFISDTIARRIVGTKDTEGVETFAEELRQAIDLDGLRRVNQWSASSIDDVRVEGVTTPCLFLPYSYGARDWVAKARTLASRMENAAVRPLRGSTWADVVTETNEAITSFFTHGRGVPEAAPDAQASEPAIAMGGSAVILFTDIVDSTALTERLGDERFRELSRALDAGLRTAIRDSGGVAVEGKLLGDGVLATFGSAAQVIEGARRCLALAAASELGLHIGLHAGDVIREEENVFGGAVNIAARICGLSAPGEILVSDVVRGMARTSAGVVFEDRGEREMKGVGDPVRVYAVVADGVRGAD